MKKLLENMGTPSPLGPLELVFTAVGEELGNFLNKSIDRIVAIENLRKDE